MSEAQVHVSADKLQAFAAQALAAVGMPQDHAITVADTMIEADLIGSDAHGVFRLPQYIAALQRGEVNPRPDMQIRQSALGTAVVHGDNGMGHLVMAQACELAIGLASDNGVAWVGTSHSNHAGAGGVYAARIADHEMVGIYGAVSGVNHIAPPGGATPLLGTNPLAIAIPAREGAPMVLDIAMSVASWGKVKAHALQGEPMPPGWMVERATGTPLLDASRANEGLMEALGGYKGAGLALAIGLLAGTLNRAAFGEQLADFADPAGGFGVNTGQFVLALDIARFMPVADFMGAVCRQLDVFQASPAMPGTDRVRLPGSERQRRREQRLASGVPLSPELVTQLQALARTLGTAPLAVAP